MTALIIILSILAILMLLVGLYGYFESHGISVFPFPKYKEDIDESNTEYLQSTQEAQQEQIPTIQEQNIIISTGYWKEVKDVITMGGEPCWKCPNCGFMHVYSIENAGGNYNNCPKCGIYLKYPW